MPANFAIETEWECLASGAPEEIATFAAIGIRYGDAWLSEAEDRLIRSNRTKVHLSAYRLAEWLASNWWRLRWEPRRQSIDWQMAHRLTAIGGGFVWPNITFSSDGAFVDVVAEPTQPRPAEPLRYLAEANLQIAAADFEASIEAFNAMVCGRLASSGIGETNLQLLWLELLAERAEPSVAHRRKLEALLGYDPEEAPENLLDRLAADAERLGESAVDELAAEGHSPISANDLQDIAAAHGREICEADAISLDDADSRAVERNSLPWQRGNAAAALARERAGVVTPTIDDAKLAQLAGVDKGLLDGASKEPLAFAIRNGSDTARIVLRSPFRENRRFDLARLLGDRLISDTAEALLPATRSYTARQKAQRAFAGQLLCPIEALVDHLGDDLSTENLSDAASYFDVSERVVVTQLVNHQKLPREYLSNAA